MTELEQLREDEDEVSFAALAQRENVHIATVTRWASPRGCRGHVLPSYKKGSRRYTTLQSFHRWLQRINDEPAASAHTPLQRARAIDAAEKQAAELGV